MTSKIREEHISRRAVVYIRQSSPTQVTHNLESQRRQYDLEGRARELGFRDVAVIDDDLGRSGSGLANRPGFQRLVADVCAGQVGAVVCIEASRLARNGRDWHHLIDFCGLVGSVIIDSEGIYDPRIPNDRLLLGMKGTMSEFELSLFRQRSFEAIRSKARRGELQFCLPAGLTWSEDGRIELDADKRVQEAIRLVLRKYEALGSARQVLLWLRRERIVLPSATYGDKTRRPTWKLPLYSTVHKIITNPMYAGAYAFGRTSDRTQVVNNRPVKTRGHVKSRTEWTVLIRDHHPGYISWDQYERNQKTLEENAHMKQRMTPKAARGGRGLMGGLLRCRRCGRKLHVTYTGVGSRVVRYSCRGAHINHGERGCISFGGLKPDEAVAAAIVDVLTPRAIDASIEAAELTTRRISDQQRAVSLELQEARYQEQIASRRYHAVDPDNRLVASELEARWNAALSRVRELESRLDDLSVNRPSNAKIDRGVLLALADSLPTVWNSPSADMRLKQRIVRLLLREVVADVDEQGNQIVLVLHWAGGRHSELRVAKNKTGQHNRCTSQNATDVLHSMAGRWPDEQIAATLNRMGLRTGAGNTWNDGRVRSLRHRLRLAAFEPACRASDRLTLTQAANELHISASLLRRLIRDGLVPAVQVVPGAPYEIPKEALQSDTVTRALAASRGAAKAQRERAASRSTLPLPGIEDA